MEFLAGYMGVSSFFDTTKIGNLLDKNTLDTNALNLPPLSDYSSEMDSMLADAVSLTCQRNYLLMDQCRSQYASMYPYQAKEEMASKTQAFYSTQEQTAKQFSSKLTAEKESFFKSYHYQFTSNVEPVKNSEGHPVAFANPDGECESAEAMKMRVAWEERQSSNIENQYKKEKNQIVNDTVTKLRDAVTSNLSSLGNQEIQEQLQQTISQGERELKNLECSRQLDIMKAGLPSYEMKKQLEEAAGKFREEEARFFAEQENSHAGKQLKEYQQMVQEFTWKQKQKIMENNEGISIASSTSLLAYFTPSSNHPDLADGIQEMVQSISSKYTFHS